MYNLPVAKNLLGRRFDVEKPNTANFHCESPGKAGVFLLKLYSQLIILILKKYLGITTRLKIQMFVDSYKIKKIY